MTYARLLMHRGLWIAFYAAVFGFAAYVAATGATAKITSVISFLLGAWALINFTHAEAERKPAWFQRTMNQIRRLDLRTKTSTGRGWPTGASGVAHVRDALLSHLLYAPGVDDETLTTLERRLVGTTDVDVLRKTASEMIALEGLSRRDLDGILDKAATLH